jgi:hypothetical protein
MKTLVSLVSEQTIPNVELIKEYKAVTDQYIFFHSTRTRKETDWIVQAADIDEAQCVLVEIDPFDLTAINNTLQSFPFEDKEYILNITGGTKLWMIAFLDRFKEIGAEIYYLTGHQRDYVKVFPRKGIRELKLEQHITLMEYLMAYGFTNIKFGKLHKDSKQAERLFKAFYNHELINYCGVFEFCRLNRQTKEKLKKDQFPANMQTALDLIGYEFGLFLDKSDFKYLSGEWLEEWVYYSIKNELGLSDEYIATGCKLMKNRTPNEMDVLFVMDHKLYVIECKTSIFENYANPDGTFSQFNLLPEVIYKSDALRSKFGLFANSTILTLNELLDEDFMPYEKHEVHLQRAELSRINIISRRKLAEPISFKKLLNI